MKQAIRFEVNGKKYELCLEPWRTLADVLREDLGLTGLKVGCGTGECGACTVLIKGKPMRSCLMLVPQARGKEILTIEGLSTNNELHPMQQAFIDHYAVQCGFCTPGMILSAKALVDENPDPTESDVRVGLSGNLCRCTGYIKIVEAVLASSRVIKERGRRNGT